MEKFPGAIDNFDILDNKFNFLFDFEDNYVNFQLKRGLIENNDFVIVNNKIWDFLKNKYGGLAIERFCYLKSERSNFLSIEISFKRVCKLFFKRINIFFLKIR